MPRSPRKLGDRMKESAAVRFAVDWIEEHLEEDLRLDDIAARAGYSKFHLNRLFAGTVGCTIHRYIHLRRLTEAARKLVEEDRAVLEIALEAGYRSHQAFTGAFRQVYGVPPREYRRVGVFWPRLGRFVLRMAGGSLPVRGGFAA